MSTEIDAVGSDEYYRRVQSVLSAINNDDANSQDQLEALFRSYPEAAETYFLLGIAAWRLQDPGRAIQWLKKAHEIDPNCRDFVDALAVINTRSGKIHDGLYFAKLSTVLEPHTKIQPLLPFDLSNYFIALKQIRPTQNFLKASVYYNRRMFVECVLECEIELRTNQEHGSSYGLLGAACLHLGHFEKARDALNAAIYLQPDEPMHRIALGNAYYHLGDPDAGVAVHREAMERAPENLDLAARAEQMTRFLSDSEQNTATREAFHKAVASRADAYAASIEKNMTDDIREAENVLYPGEKIEIALVSNSIFDDDNARHVEPLVRQLSRQDFNLRLYQQSISEDSKNAQIATSADHTRRIYDIPDEVMTIIMNGDEVDLLIDACGYSEHSRPGLTALHNAQVQIGWLQPPYGIGQPGIDVVLSDTVLHDVDAAHIAPGQQIIDIESGLFAFETLDLMAEPSPLPMLENEGVTFGVVGDLAYLDDHFTDLICRLLKECPNSRVLFGNVFKVSQLVRDLIFARFEALGFGAQVFFHDSRQHNRRDASFYSYIDIYLDPTNVNQTITLAEALALGVPVITQKGRRRDAAIGASILTSAGKSAWVAADAEDFIGIAKKLTDDPKALASTRETLPSDVLASALFDIDAHIRSMESALKAAFATSAK